MEQTATSAPAAPVDAAAEAAVTSGDRRRPGRSDSANPALIPLLRNTSEPPNLGPERADISVPSPEAKDDLGAAKGIAFGTLLAVPFWVVVGLLIWWMVR